MVASPVSAKGDNAKGAVKVDLVVTDSTEIAGSAVLNTTSDGNLIVNVNMDDAPNLSDYDVAIFWWNSLSFALVPFGNVLNTNEKGQGNANVKVDLSTLVPDGGDNICVIVYVGDMGVVEWKTPYPPYTVVPLK